MSTATAPGLQGRFRTLCVDDDASLLSFVVDLLRSEGYEVEAAPGPVEALERLKKGGIDLIVTDLRMGGEADGIALMHDAKKLKRDIMVIVMSAHNDVDTAIRAVKQGAYDFLAKPFDADELLHRVRNALATLEREEKVRRLSQEVAERYGFDHLVGKNPRMREVFERIRAVAPTDATVLIHGETGTGKELVARAIHYNSPRREQAYVSVNCAAIPETLVEAELFGHERGAFTGANARREGRFEAANGGTLFLDEIGDLPAAVQAKLLRVLQERTVERLGSNKPTAVDVRIVTATHRDLRQMVEEGAFREDLYYRINVVPITLPPLRERPDDIPLLARHFLQKHSQTHNRDIQEISPEVMESLVRHQWPGNVRELENTIERAVVLETDNRLSRIDLNPMPSSRADRFDGAAPAAASIDLDVPLKELLDTVVSKVERDYLAGVLAREGGRVGAAAARAGLNRKTMFVKMKQHGLRKEDFGSDADMAFPSAPSN